jgi:hypothetical protein
MNRQLVLGVVVAAWATGCATARTFPLPMTAGELAAYQDGQALAVYLSQPDASANVCDLGASGPHVTRVDDDLRRGLERGLTGGAIPPKLWRRCMDALVRTLGPDGSTALLTDVVKLLPGLADDAAVETDPKHLDRLTAAARLYTERKAGTGPSRDDALALESHLRQNRAAQRYGPVALKQVDALLAELELEHGFWSGKPVDAALLDALQQAKEEAALRRAAVRLPDAALREGARRRVLRLHIAASPFAEVRDHAQAVEDRVLQTGDNRVSLADHPVVRGTLDAARLPVRAVTVEQDLPKQVARLLAVAPDRRTPSVLPAIRLRKALQVELQGLSAPVTLCAPPGDLDPSPCLPPAEVKLASSLATMDRDGALHFADTLPESSAVALAQPGHRLDLVITAGGASVAELLWSLSFQTPSSLELQGQGDGAAGPDLDVAVDRRDPDRLLFTVGHDGVQQQAVVEWADAQRFRVVSRGQRGPEGDWGYAGTDGVAGTDGSAAMCPSSNGTDGSPGSDGTPGGDGGPGGPGGSGGAVRVAVSTSPDLRDETLRLLRSTLLSVGGPGGLGGRGGSGGAGGRGGSGGASATCTSSDGTTTYTVPGGNDGSSGASGSDGEDGPPGYPGPDGPVTFTDAL